MPSRTSFADLGVPADLVASLCARGIDTPFPIQALTLADGLAGRDVCGRAPTGSGKTLAFGLPMAARLSGAEPRRPLGLVLVPTRELAAQVRDELELLGRDPGGDPGAAASHGRGRSNGRRRAERGPHGRGLRVAAVYGGAGYESQLRALRRGTDVLVACPGRLEDLIGRGEVDLGAVEVVVLDEADRMADMGFLPQVRRILDRTPATRQTLLFSATLDGAVDELVRHYTREPVHHALGEDPHAGPGATHLFWRVEREARVQTTAAVVAASGPTIVFCRTKHGTDGLAKKLDRLGVRAATIHGNRSQGQRERALAAFAGGKVDALLATDVAARGIHVDDVACVVHFDPPADEKDYTHRSGRTARAGAGGTVVSLVLPEHVRAVTRMQRALDLPEGVAAVDLADLTGGDSAGRATPSVSPAPRAEPVPTRPGDAAVAAAPPGPDRPPRDGTAGGAVRGIVKFFDTRRGFGFIDRGADADLFVHHSALDVAGHRLREGAPVVFEVGMGRRGEEARRVRLARA